MSVTNGYGFVTLKFGVTSFKILCTELYSGVCVKCNVTVPILDKGIHCVLITFEKGTKAKSIDQLYWRQTGLPSESKVPITSESLQQWFSYFNNPRTLILIIIFSQIHNPSPPGQGIMPDKPYSKCG